jgi:hypothetical protein
LNIVTPVWTVVGGVSGLGEGSLVDVLDVPVTGGGYRFVDHRHVEHRRSAAFDGGAERGDEVLGPRDVVAVGPAGAAEGGESTVRISPRRPFTCARPVMPGFTRCRAA